MVVGIFRKLMGSLVELTLMYGAEIWGCSRHLEAIEQVQLLAFRMFSTEFQIEVGRWQTVTRNNRVCKECQSGEVEDVCHWLLQCPTWDHIRQPLLTQPAWDEQLAARDFH